MLIPKHFRKNGQFWLIPRSKKRGGQFILISRRAFRAGSFSSYPGAIRKEPAVYSHAEDPVKGDGWFRLSPRSKMASDSFKSYQGLGSFESYRGPLGSKTEVV